MGFLYAMVDVGHDRCRMSEQRAHPRYAIELDAELVFGQGATSIKGRTHDISLGGFSMLSKVDTPTVANGSTCVVRLALVFSETEFSEHISLEGIAMWCTRLRGGVQIGVKFSALDAQARQYLELFIHFLESGEEDDPADAKD